MRYASAGVRRFGGWKQHLGISDAVLAARLRTLVEAGVLARLSATGVGRAEYHLTPAGLDLWRVLLAIWSWELHQVPGQSARLPRMVHRTCGADFGPVLRCHHCHRATTVEDVELGLGPSGHFERSVPVGSNRRRSAVRRSPSSGPGMFAETMTLIGSRWSSAVLGAAFLGATRFSEFERMIGAPPSVVAERLRTFVALGVLEPGGVAGDAWSAYHLSAKGRAFFPVVANALAWGERWFPSPDGPAVLAVHRACGRAFVPELACSCCAGAITRRTLVVSPADVEPVAEGPRVDQ